MANSQKSIPMLDLTEETHALRTELQEAILQVLDSGQFIMGPNVHTFEAEISAYLGVKHAISVNSGTDALVIGLKAAGIGPGDEVITTGFTFFATAEAICQVGAEPVFVDIDPRTYNLDPKSVGAAITSKTRAIIPVHLFGHAVDMAPMMELAKQHGLRVIEDVAQALGGEYNGQKLGTIGDVGCCSFFPSKNLGAYGDGGLIATNDDQLAEMAKKLRAHGSLIKYHNELIGYNSRLDELQAAILRVKVPYLDRQNQCRIEAARMYDVLLEGLPQLELPVREPYAKHVYHQYTLRVKAGLRDRLKAQLAEKGIQSMIYYPVPIHQLPVFVDQGVQLPNCEKSSGEVLSLPLWPGIDQSTQEHIAQVIRESLHQASRGG